MPKHKYITKRNMAIFNERKKGTKFRILGEMFGLIFNRCRQIHCNTKRKTPTALETAEELKVLVAALKEHAVHLKIDEPDVKSIQDLFYFKIGRVEGQVDNLLELLK